MPSCPFCFEEGSNAACLSCREDVFLDGVSSLSSYADKIVQEAIKHWKYYGDRAYEEVIVRWLREGIQHLSFPSRPYFVTHVPLHIRRRRERGFDQAHSIAQVVAAEFGLEHIPLLRRRAQSTHQAGIGRSDRMVGDLDHLFEIEAPVPEHVLLCDDVFTSGATMDAAAKTLKEAGAKTVWGVTIARGR